MAGAETSTENNPEKINDDQTIERKNFCLEKFIENLHEKILQINAPNTNDGNNAVSSMEEQLKAIVKETEIAANDILKNLEGIDRIIGKIRTSGTDKEICDQISHFAMNAMESCTFQDITGQRINKIIDSIKAMEERVNTVVNMVDHTTSEKNSTTSTKDSTPEEENLLDGPQLSGMGMSQKDVDGMFD